MSSCKEESTLETFDRQNRCINCSFLIPKNFPRCYSVEETSSKAMIRLLQTWIAPTQLSSECILCRECFELLRNKADVSDESHSALPAFGHRKICFPCGRTILRAQRTYAVHHNQEKTKILIRMVPHHLISRMEQVCAACMRSATRQAHRLQQHDENRSIAAPSDNSAVPEPPPLPLPPPPPTTPTVQVRQKVISSIYKRAANASAKCMFDNCFERERLLVPAVIKEKLLLNNKFYVPPSARVCHYHLNHGSFNELNSRLRDFTGAQFDNMMTMMQRVANNRVDFSNISVMPPHLVNYWLGMSSEQFYDLLKCIPNLAEQVPNAAVALCIHLVKSRTGDSNERLATLFNTPRATLERWMTKARNCLSHDFVL